MLTKCQCDDTTPCKNCADVDAICTREKLEEPRETNCSPRLACTQSLLVLPTTPVSPTSYRHVRFLQHENEQIKAGVQKFYCRMLENGGWTEPRLENGSNGRPLTHDILTALKVLSADRSEDWEDVASEDENDSTYQEAGPPVTQATLSQPSPIQTPNPNSSIMSRRQSEVQTGLVRTAMPTTQSYSMAPHLTNYSASGFHSQAFTNQRPMPTAMPTTQSYSMAPHYRDYSASGFLARPFSLNRRYPQRIIC